MSAPTAAPTLDDLLTDDELERVLYAFALGRDRSGRNGGRFTAEEAQLVGSWANETKCMATILDMVLKGGMLLEVEPDGDVAFALASTGWGSER